MDRIARETNARVLFTSIPSGFTKAARSEFDREYMNAMVMGHEEVATKLRSMSGDTATSTSTSTSTTKGQSVGTSGSDTALKQWAGKTLPTVQKHLERAKELQQKVR